MTVSIRRYSMFPMLLLALAVACGGEEKPAAAPEAMPEATPGGGAMAPAPPAPGEVVWGKELPAGFPDDVPVYPGATVKRTRASNDQSVVVSFESDDDMAVVAKYYEDTFAVQGWSTQVKNMPEGKVILGDKDNRSAAVTITIGEEKTQIDILLFQVN